MLKRLLVLMAILAVFVGGYLVAFNANWLGVPPGKGEIEGVALPAPVITNRQARRDEAAAAVGVIPHKEILFGDLHVHTTYSTDAFIWSLPMNQGNGPHPIADACDFARYCSGLDFWAITDHAESSTPRRWQETKESIRQCQAIAGNDDNPDMLSFVGFEWTQVGPIPAEHWGHKNVLFRDLDDPSLAARPIAAEGLTLRALRQGQASFPPAIPVMAGSDSAKYFNFNAFAKEISDIPLCDPGLPSNELPLSCTEVAASPDILLQKLDDQGLDPLIVPHGTTWGYYTPNSVTWNKALKKQMRPQDFSLIEIYSGHGNSEEYRDFTNMHAIRDAEGEFHGSCVPPSNDFTPSCWRAGEIIRDRCLQSGESETECDKRAVTARQHHADLGNAGHLSIPGVSFTDWLDSDQCRDCFQPSMNYRPGGSVQAGLATRGFTETPDNPTRFKWGFIASSDNHRARPGTGYKEYQRHLNTEASGALNEAWRKQIFGPEVEKVAHSIVVDRQQLIDKPSLAITELERQAGFFLTGGLAAVHSTGRSREEIWDAMKRRETYGTSGPRMMLWFDLLNAGGDGNQVLPMGSDTMLDHAPVFKVRATGAYKQAPGLPDHIEGSGISAARLQKICGGEAFNPTSERHAITRIEIVRIRPQTSPEQSLSDLIDDPFLVKQCNGDRKGCSFEFTDPDYDKAGRDMIYYARAIQEATPTINGDNLRCDYDENGVCIKVNPCHGDYRTRKDDTCLAMSEHRAWSSPIYLSWQ